MMKRQLILLILLLSLITGASYASYDNIDYHVDSLGCTINVPTSFFVLHKDLSLLQLIAISFTQKEVEEFLDSHSLEFLAVNSDDTFELQAVKYSSPLSIRLSDKSDSFLNGFLSTFIPAKEKALGVPIPFYEIKKTKHNVYIRYDCSFDGNPKQNLITYYTCSDGFIYEFHFYCGEVVEEVELDLINSIMGKVIWDK